APVHAADVRDHADAQCGLWNPVARVRRHTHRGRRATCRRFRRHARHQHRNRAPPGRHRSDRRRDRARAFGVLHERPRGAWPTARSRSMTGPGSIAVHLAVNGTLMRGLELNANMIDAGATFVRETTTAPVYRLWSIADRHPAMIRVAAGGVAVAVEGWAVPPGGVAEILMREPPGLALGTVTPADGEEVLGVLGEPLLVEGQREITSYGGWRAYTRARAT